MESLIHISIIIHVSAGFGALLFGALAIILKRDTPKHKVVGRIYFWCMSIIFVTGIYLSVVKGLLFFFFIAIFSYYATIVAYRALRLKNLHLGQKPLWIDWFVEAVAALTFLGMVLLGILVIVQKGHYDGFIPLVFGMMGLQGVYQHTKEFIKGPKETNYWLRKHIGNMCGSYIGAITAFVVNQSGKIPLPEILLWLGPSAIIMPIIIVELKKVKSEPLTVD